MPRYSRVRSRKTCSCGSVTPRSSAATGPVTVITVASRAASCCNNPARGGHRREVRIPMSDGVALAATLYLPDTSDPAAVPAGGAALPQGRPDVVVRRVVRAAARQARVRRVPARPARHRVVGRRRARRVPAGRAARPGRGDRAGWPPRTGATGRSACGARRTPASTRSRWPASSRRSSRRSARSTPPTTAGPTTCTGAAARCGWSTSSTTTTT